MPTEEQISEPGGLGVAGLSICDVTTGDDEGFRARETWYDIPEGSIPDMKCGGARQGEIYYDGVQEFRPQYLTAEVDDTGKLAQLRIWGRRIKADGSLGKRHLDFVWDF